MLSAGLYKRDFGTRFDHPRAREKTKLTDLNLKVSNISNVCHKTEFNLFVWWLGHFTWIFRNKTAAKP